MRCPHCPLTTEQKCPALHHSRYCDLVERDRSRLNNNPNYFPYWIRWVEARAGEAEITDVPTQTPITTVSPPLPPTVIPFKIESPSHPESQPDQPQTAYISPWPESCPNLGPVIRIESGCRCELRYCYAGRGQDGTIRLGHCLSCDIAPDDYKDYLNY
jgi:hypothetical protein